MNYRTAYQRTERDEWRRNGCCVYCGRPAILKTDGTYARRCEVCRESHRWQKADAKARKAISERLKKQREVIHKKKMTFKQLKAILDRLNKERRIKSGKI